MKIRQLFILLCSLLVILGCKQPNPTPIEIAEQISKLKLPDSLVLIQFYDKAFDELLPDRSTIIIYKLEDQQIDSIKAQCIKKNYKQIQGNWAEELHFVADSTDVGYYYLNHYNPNDIKGDFYLTILNITQKQLYVEYSNM